jgi:hypothetical protein
VLPFRYTSLQFVIFQKKNKKKQEELTSVDKGINTIALSF